MTALKTLGALVIVIVGFIAFVLWLGFYKIPRNLVKEFDDYAS